MVLRYLTMFSSTSPFSSLTCGGIHSEKRKGRKSQFLFTAQLLRKTNLAEIFSEARSGTIAHKTKKELRQSPNVSLPMGSKNQFAFSPKKNLLSPAKAKTTSMTENFLCVYRVVLFSNETANVQSMTTFPPLFLALRVNVVPPFPWLCSLLLLSRHCRCCRCHCCCHRCRCCCRHGCHRRLC